MDFRKKGRRRWIGRGPEDVPGLGCPAAGDWASLAVGLLDSERSRTLLAHAIQCDECGALLRAAAEDLGSDVTDAESKELGELVSAQPEWQREMARKMAQASRPVPRPHPQPAQWLGWAAALLIAVGGGYWSYDQWSSGQPARLIAQAYSQQRPFEFRFPAADYGPVRQQKGANGSSQSPASLLEAEARVARELTKRPDDARWLAWRAETEMLSWDPETAIATLTRALDRKPDDPALSAELGIAYALRAEAQNRSVDYGTAIEHLTRAIRLKPGLRDALFNRAIVYERLFLYDEAIQDWRRYLSLDSSSAWADEARRRLAELEQKKK